MAPTLTFERLATAINTSFGRWDLHLHAFELADGRLIGYPDDEDQAPWIDHATARLGDLLDPGDALTFTFDLGDEWLHRCRVLDERIDPRELFGETPRDPVVLAGWGWLPDQYGRETEDEE